MVRLKKFFLFSVLFAQITLPMAPPAPARQVDQADIDRALAGAQETIGRIPAILEGVRNREQVRRREEADRKRTAMINQNTIVVATPPGALPVRLALFRRDLVTGGFI